jgi:hypothetical protein
MTEEDPWSQLASAMSSFDREEEDDISLDIRERLPSEPEDPRLEKTPLYKGKRYLKIRAAVEAHLEGRIDKMGFLNRIRPLAVTQAQAVKVMDKPEIKERFAKLPEEESLLFEEVRRCLAAVAEELRKMLAYKENDRFADVQVAMRQIDEIYLELHQAQDDIVAIGRRNLAGS